jgi:hypothetical protein
MRRSIITDSDLLADQEPKGILIIPKIEMYSLFPAMTFVIYDTLERKVDLIEVTRIYFGVIFYKSASYPVVKHFEEATYRTRYNVYATRILTNKDLSKYKLLLEDSDFNLEELNKHFRSRYNKDLIEVKLR